MVRKIRTLICIGLVSILVTACQQKSPFYVISPLSPAVTPKPISTGGKIYGAQILNSAWAPGAPYPVFFYDVPVGTTKVIVQDIAYGVEKPLADVHPRLEKVSQRVIWPGGETAQVIAADFIYDEQSGTLLTYNATMDGLPLETFYDIFSCPGVGVAYLGDVKGVNIFYNCATPISIQYQELSKDEQERPTEAFFRWDCEGNSYETHTIIGWGKSDLVYQIDVITDLTVTITRK